jgi:hypothetical protein
LVEREVADAVVGCGGMISQVLAASGGAENWHDHYSLSLLSSPKHLFYQSLLAAT